MQCVDCGSRACIQSMTTDGTKKSGLETYGNQCIEKP